MIVLNTLIGIILVVLYAVSVARFLDLEKRRNELGWSILCFAAILSGILWLLLWHHKIEGAPVFLSFLLLAGLAHAWLTAEQTDIGSGQPGNGNQPNADKLSYALALQAGFLALIFTTFLFDLVGATSLLSAVLLTQVFAKSLLTWHHTMEPKKTGSSWFFWLRSVLTFVLALFFTYFSTYAVNRSLEKLLLKNAKPLEAKLTKLATDEAKAQFGNNYSTVIDRLAEEDIHANLGPLLLWNLLYGDIQYPVDKEINDSGELSSVNIEWPEFDGLRRGYSAYQLSNKRTIFADAYLPSESFPEDAKSIVVKGIAGLQAYDFLLAGATGSDNSGSRRKLNLSMDLSSAEKHYEHWLAIYFLWFQNQLDEISKNASTQQASISSPEQIAELPAQTALTREERRARLEDALRTIQASAQHATQFYVVPLPLPTGSPYEIRQWVNGTIQEWILFAFWFGIIGMIWQFLDVSYFRKYYRIPGDVHPSLKTVLEVHVKELEGLDEAKQQHQLALLRDSLERYFGTVKRLWKGRSNLFSYVNFALPLLGLLGTVAGISGSFKKAPAFIRADNQIEQEAAMGLLSGAVSVAFFTTLAACYLALIFYAIHHMILERYERSVERDLAHEAGEFHRSLSAFLIGNEDVSEYFTEKTITLERAEELSGYGEAGLTLLKESSQESSGNNSSSTTNSNKTEA